MVFEILIRSLLLTIFVSFVTCDVLWLNLNKGPCNVNPAYKSLLYRFNILYLTCNLFHRGQPPNPRVRCALLAARNCWIFGLGVLIYRGQPLYPWVCYAVLLSICMYLNTRNNITYIKLSSKGRTLCIIKKKKTTLHFSPFLVSLPPLSIA
jgi:hypothetical protein